MVGAKFKLFCINNVHFFNETNKSIERFSYFSVNSKCLEGRGLILLALKFLLFDRLSKAFVQLFFVR